MNDSFVNSFLDRIAENRTGQVDVAKRLKLLWASDPFATQGLSLTGQRDIALGVKALKKKNWWKSPPQRAGDALGKLIASFHPRPPYAALRPLQKLISHPDPYVRSASMAGILRLCHHEGAGFIKNKIAQGEIEPADLFNGTGTLVKHQPTRQSLTPQGLKFIADVYAECWQRLPDQDKAERIDYVASADANIAAVILFDESAKGFGGKEFDDSCRRLALEGESIDGDRLEILLQSLASELAHGEDPPQGLLTLGAWAQLDVLKPVIERVIRQPDHPLFSAALNAAKIFAGLGPSVNFFYLFPEKPASASSDDLSILTPLERIARLTYDFEAEVFNGGLKQLFFNSTRLHLRNTVDALNEIGDVLASEVLQEAVEILGDDTIGLLESGDRVEFPEHHQQQLNGLTDRIYKRTDMETSDRLSLHMLRHAEQVGGRHLDWLTLPA